MSVNKVILVGNVGQDPEVRYVKDDVAVANFTLATTERYKSATGENVERTEWHRIVLWRNLAKIAENYVRKGTQVYIEGRIQSRKWTDQNNVERTAYEIMADNMQLLGRKGDNPAATTEAKPAAAPVAQKPAAAQAEPFGGETESDDNDLPF